MKDLYEEDSGLTILHSRVPPSDRFFQRLRSSILSAFDSQSKQSRCRKVKVTISCLLVAFSTIQSLSLVLLGSDDMKEYAALREVFELVNYARVDTLAFAVGKVDWFFYAGICGVYLPLGVLVGNVTMNLWTKRKPHWLTVLFMSTVFFLLEELLMLPVLVLTCSYIKYTYISPAASHMLEYFHDPGTLNSPLHAGLSVLTVPVLLSTLYLNSYFYYENSYSKRTRQIYSMADSYIHRTQIALKAAMVLCYCFLSLVSEVWYRLGILIISSILLVRIYKRIAYFNLFVNALYAGQALLVSWCVVCYFVGYAIDSATAVVVLVLFTSPLLLLRLCYSVWRRSAHVRALRVAGLDQPYLVELKLRGYLEALENSEKTMRKKVMEDIDQLFTFAFLRFFRDPLIPLWEAAYYWSYRKDAFNALLKLSKSQFCERSLESQFFTEKFHAKFTLFERSPERMCLHYLTLLDRAKQSDEECCMHFLSLTTDLLSKSIDPRKLHKSVISLSAKVHSTLKRYKKALNLDIENEDALRLIGSFLTDICKDCEGQKYVTQAEMLRANRETTGLLSEMINEKQGLMVVGCGPPEPGTIVLANYQACGILNAAKSDIEKRPLSGFLIPPFRALLDSVLGEVYTFGKNCSEVQSLCKLLVDPLGFLVPADVEVKVTTWENRAYLLLCIRMLGSTDILALDPRGAVIGNSRLLGVLSPEQSRLYEGESAESVIPGLYEVLKSQQPTHQGASGAVEIEYGKIQCRGVVCDVLCFATEEGLRKKQPSSFSAGRRGVRRVSTRAVRFTADNALRSVGSKGELLTSLQEKTMDSLFSVNAEAKLKRKLDRGASDSLPHSLSQESSDSLRTRSAARRLRLLLLFSFLLLAAGLAASAIFVSKILDSLKSITVIKHYSDRNALLVSLAYDVRSLMLADNPAFPYQKSVILERIYNTSVTLDWMEEYMKGLVGGDFEGADSFLTQKKVTIWRKVEDRYQQEETSMLDAMFEVSATAAAFSSLSVPYAPLPESFFLYRNCAGEFLQAANSTLHLRVHSESRNRADSLAVIECLIYLCVGLIVLPLGTLVLPQFYLFEKGSRGVWESVGRLQKDAVLETRAVCVERLSTAFSTDISLPTPHHKPLSAVSPVSQWPQFLLSLCVYLLANAVFFAVMETQFLKPIQELAVTIPNYLFWSAMRPTLIVEGLFWAREEALKQFDQFSYGNTVEEFSLWPNPSERVTNALRTMAFIKNTLRFGDSRFGVLSTQKSQQFLTVVLVNGCSDSSDLECTSGEESMGQSFKLVNQVLSLKALAGLSHTTLNAVYEAIATAEDLAVDAERGIRQLADSYERSSVAEIDSNIAKVATLTVVFIAAVLLLYVCVYVRKIQTMAVNVGKALEVRRMLRSKAIMLIIIIS